MGTLFPICSRRQLSGWGHSVFFTMSRRDNRGDTAIPHVVLHSFAGFKTTGGTLEDPCVGC